MLLELAVSDLGVIRRLSLVLGPGMTALTGETGAGKTLIVEALDLLVGGRADATLVRPGAEEARVEGRFVVGDDEVVLTRVVPADGRSRAYVDGRIAPIGALAEAGARLVDLHGQHAHQSLLGPAVQRAALDRYGGVDLGPLRAARHEVAALDRELAAMGGDARARARELDLLRYQLDELVGAELDDPDEESALAEEEAGLADAVAHREAASAAHLALTGDGGAGDAVAGALAAVAGLPPFAEVEARLRAVAAEMADAALDVRATGEAVVDDPERLAEVQARRHHLRDLRRKYAAYLPDDAEGTLADLVRYRDAAARRVEELEGWDARAGALEARRDQLLAGVAHAAAAVAAARRTAAAPLARAVEGHLAELAMPRARVEVAVGEEDPGDDVAFLLAANPGAPLLPLARVASGGELARAMLALRLVLTAGPPVLVFDEVDAGIGGEAALAVGRALANLAADHQVLVVTHLPQVAAFADAQVAVVKATDDAATTTATTAEVLDPVGRVVELSRMLSGQPDSRAARGHAEELLAVASQHRSRR